MILRSFVMVLVAAATTASAQRLSTPLGNVAGVRLTASCPTDDTTAVAIVDATPAFRAEMVAAANSPGSDPVLSHDLWNPASGRQTNYLVFENQVLLDYADRFQNIDEIVRDINANASLAGRGLAHAWANSYACFSPNPPPPIVRVSEYFNAQLNHYQLAVGDAESRDLASSGWVPTGDSFKALGQGACYGATDVFRFARSLGKNRGSNFLTADAGECGEVRKRNPAWRPRDVPFFATQPAAGGCVGGGYGARAVYRLYNGREMFNDMNHRFTTDGATYATMIAQGWIGEGIAFCVPGE